MRLPVVNRVMVSNALLAAAVGRECGLTMEEIGRVASRRCKLPGARMQVVKAHGAWIINDAYNANPDSMKRGADGVEANFPVRRSRLAVLGSMGELGQHAAELHYATSANLPHNKAFRFPDRGRPSCGGLRQGRDGGGAQGHHQIVAALDAGEATTVALKPLLRENDGRVGQGLALHGAGQIGRRRITGKWLGKGSH